MKKTVSFYTLGCKVNQYETNAMEQQFIKNNYDDGRYAMRIHKKQIFM